MDEEDKAEEPAELYQRILFSSFNKMDESNYNYWLSLNPAERISRIVELIKVVYAEELKKPVSSLRLYFDRI